MAWTSFIPSATIRDSLNNVIAMNAGGATPDTLKLSLYGNSVTETIDSDPAHYGDAGWTTEITGTGWAGPYTLAGNSLTRNPGAGIKFTATNVSAPSTTISTAVYGCTIWDYTISTTAGPVLVAVYFGTGYTTNNGTFGITWDSTNGIFNITLH